MSTLATEWLINKTRFMFITMFLIVAYGSYLNKSDAATWGGITGTSLTYLVLAIVNQVYIYKKKISPLLIYISVTIEITLLFITKFVMHYDSRSGYGMTIKEPATFVVYFLFIIISALRYDKKLNIYAGTYAVISYIILLIFAITDGGMYFTSDISQFFEKQTLRAASEIPKIIFLIAFTFFIYKMADFTNQNMKRLQNAEKESYNNFLKMKDLLQTVEKTAEDLLVGSKELTNSSNKIDTIIKEHAQLMSDVDTITKDISMSIEEIKNKSNFQYKTVEENFTVIKKISNLMDAIYKDSTSQSAKADEALRLATINEQNINRTLTFITDMRENSKRIEDISHTIREIADQTNLLSLNAAIESARAGEHGKGFAVVADEISKLATMSVDSSKEIATIIKDTVSNIENASSMIATLAQYLNQIISFVKENSNFMNSLMEKTSNEYEESKNLYSSTEEVDKAAKNVIDHSDNQSKLVEKITTWFYNMNILGRDISGSLKDLKSLSDRLEVRSVEMKQILEQKNYNE